MPRNAKPEDVLEQEVGLSEALQTPEKPVVDAKVVYLGSKPHFALSMRGRLIVEKVGEDRVRRTATRAGREHYDFATRGSDGEPVPTTPTRGLMPPDHPVVEVRGKPFVVCSHIDHLYEFSQMREGGERNGTPLFRIVAAPGPMRIISDYVSAKLRAKRSKDRFTEAVAA